MLIGSLCQFKKRRCVADQIVWPDWFESDVFAIMIGRVWEIRLGDHVSPFGNPQRTEADSMGQSVACAEREESSATQP